MSIFNDKALKSVAEAAAKIMQQEELKGNQHKIDANKNGKIDAHDFKLLRGKKNVKEETEQLDELSKSTLGSYVKKATKSATSSSYIAGEHGPATKPGGKSLQTSMKRERGVRKAVDRLTKEETELDEAFPTVADAKKRMDAGKTSSGTVTKTKTGLVHKRDYKDDNDADDAPKKSSGYGARQNYKRSTRVNESLSFTEMLELYSEHGIKVLAPIEVEEMDVDGTTIEVIDADKVNGFVETTIEEEATEEEFNKELKDQQASFAGKKPQPKVAAGKTVGVKNMPESVELDEEQLDERAKWRSTSVAKKRTDPRYGDSESYDYHYDNPNSTGNLRPTTDKPHSYGSLQTRPKPKVASQGARKGMITKQHAERLKNRIKSNLSAMKKEEVELDERTLTKGEAKKKEDYVMGMKKKLSGFKQRYGERAKEVMYATATSMAKKD